jgi:Tfp pilus assembly protein PilF
MRYNLALAYIGNNQDDLARESLTEVVKLDPAYWDAYYRLGHLFIKEQDMESAKSIFKMLLNKNPAYEKKDEINRILAQ